MAVSGVAETRIVLRCYHDGHRATTAVPSTNPSPCTFCAHTPAMQCKVLPSSFLEAPTKDPPG
ncbi:hypothetical protein M422DRAFT_39654, partial [Sphaerobolus stellatus SS14]